MGETIPLSTWLAIALTAARVGAMTLTAPLFGSRTAPWRVRLALLAALTFLVAPTQARSLAWTGYEQAMAWLVREIVIGLALGMAVMLVIAGVRMAGQTMAQAAGFHGGGWMDPQLGDGEPCGRMMELTTIAILLAAGGHRLAIDALLDTFHWMPPGSTQLFPLQSLVELAGVSFTFAARATAPIVAAALGAQLLVAMLARAQPTLRQAALGSTNGALAAVGMWLLSLGAVGFVALDELQTLLSQVRQLLTR